MIFGPEMTLAKPPRGRPADPAKRAAVLVAAQQLFTTHGFAGTSMDDIARAAHTSKLTVYRNFGSKLELFAAAIRSKCEAMLTPAALPIGTMGARAALNAFGQAFLGLILSPEAVATHRLIIAERDRSPDLGPLFHDNAIEPTTSRLAALLSLLGIVNRDLDIAARDLLTLWRGAPTTCLEFGLPAMQPDELAHHVSHCTDLCLAAWRMPVD